MSGQTVSPTRKIDPARLDRVINAETNCFACLDNDGCSYSSQIDDPVLAEELIGAEIIYRGDEGAGWGGGTLLIAIRGEECLMILKGWVREDTHLIMDADFLDLFNQSGAA